MKKLLLALLVLLFAVSAMAASPSKWLRPPTQQVAVTASDATVYSPPLVSMFIGTAGALRVILSEDGGTFDCSDAPIHTAVAAGLFRGRISKVCATGTDAADFVGYTFGGPSLP